MHDFWKGFEKQALKKGVELQSHQNRVLRRLDKEPGVLVYHGLGSGKTLTSIAATEGESTEVVVPASLRENYKKEVRKFTKGHKPDIKSFEKFLKQDRPQAKNIVIDEAHMAGRHESKRSQNLMALVPEYGKRVLLTGSPVRNHPSELAPLLRMLRGGKDVPTDKKEFSKVFIKEHTEKPGFFGRLLGRTSSTTYSLKNEKKFRELIRGIVDYHAGGKEDFPLVTEETVKVPMSKEQLNIYKFLMNKVTPAMRYKIKKGLPPSKQESKSLNSFLGGVRQVSNSARPFGGEEESKIDAMVREVKLRIKDDKTFKGMAYSNFLNAGINPLARKLDAEGIPHKVFTGTMNDKEKAQAISSYNRGKVKMILLSGAGSQGLDLKGTKLVQIMEPHWNKSRTNQVKGRAVRYKSHSHLPSKERFVHVQNFHSTVPAGTLDKIKREVPLSSDEYLEGLAALKEDLNEKFLSIMRDEGGKE